MKISLGVLIGIALIIYWWVHDHPATAPVRQGLIDINHPHPYYAGLIETPEP